MRQIFVSFAAILMLLVRSVAAVGQSGPPQQQLNVYVLSGNPYSADISPDEEFAVTQITRFDSTSDSSSPRAVELAQLWDFRQHRLMAEVPLAEAGTVKDHPSQDFPRFIRFTGDGKLVVVYLDHFLYVLNGNDLREVREVQMNGPRDVTDSFKYKSVVHSIVTKPSVELLEVSPVGHEVVAIWNTGKAFTQADVYDLDSGKQLGERETYGLKALAWEANGQQLVIAVPNASPSSPPGTQPDLYVVEAVSGAVQMQLNTGLLVGGVSVTSDDRAWVVDYDSLGVFRNHDPKMRVFDLHTGKRVHEIVGRGSGVRYAVSASLNGGRVAAFTGIVKAGFDWGDMVPFDSVVDRTFSVWDSNSYKESSHLRTYRSQRRRVLSHGVQPSASARRVDSCSAAQVFMSCPPLPSRSDKQRQSAQFYEGIVSSPLNRCRLNRKVAFGKQV